MSPLLPKRAKPIAIDIALQGGGAHGAFTWGVLERLLDEPDLRLTSISGASAGAMNAVVLAAGLVEGGPKAAQIALWSFWKSVNRAARAASPAFSTYEQFPLLFTASQAWWSLISAGRVKLSLPPEAGAPAQTLLGDLLRDSVDFEALRGPKAPRLFISATDARSGQARIFTNADLSVEAVLASACLPTAFPPVIIDGVEYWDGGYSANPPLLPLITDSPNHDLLLVTINPIRREAAPTTLEDIPERISEMMFNQSLVKDVRAISILKQSLSQELPATAPKLIQALHKLRLHEIHDEVGFSQIHPSSKMLPEWQLLIQLHGAGQVAAEAWLKTHGAALGEHSTAELTDRYL